MKAWKLVSLLLAIALIVAVIFCVNLSNTQKAANAALAEIKGNLDAAQTTIAEKEQALTDAASGGKEALEKAAADGEAKLKEALEKAEADKKAALEKAEADGEAS
jgi:colicin import membrane protein